MYECVCGFASATATGMHRHLTDAGGSGGHRLKTSFLRGASRHTGSASAGAPASILAGPGQPAAAQGLRQLRTSSSGLAGTAAGCDSGASTPHSPLYGFTAVSPAEAWDSVAQLYAGSPSHSQQQQHLQPAQHATGAASGPLRSSLNQGQFRQAQAQAQAQGMQGSSAIAVQLAAGISLQAQHQQQEPQLPVSQALARSSMPAEQQQHAQQAPQAGDAAAFGVSLSGTLLAAAFDRSGLSGWVVNQAVHAAAAAFAGPSQPDAAPQAAAQPASSRSQQAAGSLGRAADAGQAAADATSSSKATPRAEPAGAAEASGWSLSSLLTRSALRKRLGSSPPGDGSEAAAHAASLKDRAGAAGTTTTTTTTTSSGSIKAAAKRLSLRRSAAAAAAAAASGSDARSGRSLAGAGRGSPAGGSAALLTESEDDSSDAGGWVTAVGLAPAAASSSGALALAGFDQAAIAGRVASLRGLLLWQRGGASTRALAAGLYCCLLLGNVPRALAYCQPTTLLASLALSYLAYNLAKPWAVRLWCSASRQPGGAAPRLLERLAAAEARAAGSLLALACAAGREAGLWALAVLALAHRALRGQRFTTTAWTVASLWLLLLVSELRLVSQTLLAMAGVGGLFAVPWLYARWQPVLDAALLEALSLLGLLVVHAERWTYGLALAAGALVWSCLEGVGGAGLGLGDSLVVQGSGAALAALSVLVWRVLAAGS